MTTEQEFLKRSGSIYRNMKARFAEKRNKRGNVIRVGRELPFSLEEFRDYLSMCLGSRNASGTTPCDSCTLSLNALTLVVDHSLPVSRGGELGLQNLALLCEECNRAKGKLTASEFRALRQFLDGLAPQAANDVLTRLKTGAGFMRLRYFGKGKRNA